VIVHCVAMVAATLAMSLGAGAWLTTLSFSSEAVWREGKVWQLATYPFIHAPSLLFVLEMLMFFWFGREVERFVGRDVFLGLYAALILLPALFLTAAGLWIPQSYAGSGTLHFSIFVAFATLYPGIELIFRILAKWAAWVCLAIYSLQFMANREWILLLALWVSAGIAYYGMRLVGVGGGLDWWENWQEGRRTARLAKERNFQIVRESSVDAILEKISKHGIGSLTATERETLEKERAHLLKKESH
jgi:membrane associated rhomboid family serine protease